MILLDANVLIYAINSANSQYAPSLAVITAGFESRLPVVVVPQVLTEFIAVTTNPRRVATPIDLPAAWRQVEAFRSGLLVLDLLPMALDILGALIEASARRGPRIYDLFLAAQMQAHGITLICTYNTRDFAGLPGIEALTPEQVLANLG